MLRLSYDAPIEYNVRYGCIWLVVKIWLERKEDIIEDIIFVLLREYVQLDGEK